MMAIGGERTALPRFEIHDVVAHRPTVQRTRGMQGFLQNCRRHSETGIDGFSATNGLEGQIHRSAFFYSTDGIGDVREHAALRGHGILLAEVINQMQQC